jgi:hypothetical protein
VLGEHAAKKREDIKEEARKKASAVSHRRSSEKRKKEYSHQEKIAGKEKNRPEDVNVRTRSIVRILGLKLLLY